MGLSFFIFVYPKNSKISFAKLSISFLRSGLVFDTSVAEKCNVVVKLMLDYQLYDDRSV